MKNYSSCSGTNLSIIAIQDFQMGYVGKESKGEAVMSTGLSLDVVVEGNWVGERWAPQTGFQMGCLLMAWSLITAAVAGEEKLAVASWPFEWVKVVRSYLMQQTDRFAGQMGSIQRRTCLG